MANCGGTSISQTPGCFTNCSPTVTQTNCGCTPCTAPVIVQGDLSNQVLVPVLADVIQNCISLSRCETAYPDNLFIETNLSRAGTATQPVPSGTICITDVSYSYSCIGVPGTAGAVGTGLPGPVPTILANVGCSALNLTPTTPSCTCPSEADAASAKTTALYTDFSGLARTGACCCNQVAQAYSQNRIVERNIPFSACNLNITVRGTIGGQPFTGRVLGTYTGGDTVTALPNPTSLVPATGETSDLGFAGPLNFCGIMCLPTSTRLTINESFDNCLSVDCIRPNTATYSVADDLADGTVTTPDTENATFLASADLSLIISKNIFATTSEKLAVISSAGAQVVCSDNVQPVCPQGNPCESKTPCPGPRPVIPTPTPIPL